MDVARAYRRFKKGNLSLEKLQAIITNAKPEQLVQRDERYPQGNNESREGFSQQLQTKKGLFFQNIIKKAVIAAIGLAHQWMLDEYDKDIYVYSDERLQRLDKFGREYINLNFRDTSYKIDFMVKILEFTLGLAKEDVYYRARLFDAINMFVGYEMFILTEAEKVSINWIRNETYFCAKCGVEHKGMAPVLTRQGEVFAFSCGVLKT